MEFLKKAKKAAAAAGLQVGGGGKDLKYFQSTKKGERNWGALRGMCRNRAERVQTIVWRWTLAAVCGGFPACCAR